MDDIVMQAMVKWPNVPYCYGWLGLDGRGDWYLRDDAAQACGEFASSVHEARGSRLQHEKLIDFIQRNYACDASGAWFFQNGPQRVYVELMHTPWVWRIHPEGHIVAHTGLAATVQESYLDELGLLYLETQLGIGLIHTADMAYAASKVEHGEWLPQEIQRSEMESRFAFVRSPQSAKGKA